jgi:hypothetical protein
MKLPNYQNAIVPIEKLENYLLSDIHPIGRTKAIFLKNLGYHENDTELLARAFLTIAQEADVADVQSSAFGTKYIIEGMIQTPSGAAVAMRTVWIIESDSVQPRLVTAYPARPQT